MPQLVMASGRHHDAELIQWRRSLKQTSNTSPRKLSHIMHVHPLTVLISCAKLPLSRAALSSACRACSATCFVSLPIVVSWQ